MAESQAVHRQHLEKRALDSNINAQTRGQYLAFAIVMVAIIGGFVLIWNDKDTFGIAAILGSLASLVAVFVVGRTKQKQELTKKAEAFGPRPTQ